MPFTPSHVAAALPFARTPLLPSALVIGTMAPDLVYFVPLPIHRTFTHALGGVFSIDLLLGAVLYLLWRMLLRRPMVDFTPLPFRARIASLPWTALRDAGTPWWRVVLLLLVSLLVGGVTHVFWDSFTHAGAVVDALPGLATQLHDHPVYKWLQWGSSLFGFLGVVVWVVVWLHRARVVAPAATRISRTMRWVGWISVTLVGLTVSLPIWLGGAANGVSLVNNQLVFRTVTVGIAAVGAAVVVWSVVWHLRTPRPADGQPSSSNG